MSHGASRCDWCSTARSPGNLPARTECGCLYFTTALIPVLRPTAVRTWLGIPRFEPSGGPPAALCAAGALAASAAARLWLCFPATLHVHASSGLHPAVQSASQEVRQSVMPLHLCAVGGRQSRLYMLHLLACMRSNSTCWFAGRRGASGASPRPVYSMPSSLLSKGDPSSGERLADVQLAALAPGLRSLCVDQ